jgi:hypothetical protein
LQVHYQIPQISNLTAKPISFPNGSAIEEEVNEYNMFVLFVSETLVPMNTELDKQKRYTLKKWQQFKNHQSFQAILLDFLDPEAMIGVISDNLSKRILQLNKENTVIECLD